MTAPDSRARELVAARRITWVVTALYFLAGVIVLRDVVFAIDDVLAGDAVIVGDELVPFFNPHSQLLDQAAGAFNELTHGYEFRVRYSFLTTWLRQYQVLPFALLIVIPAIFAVAYRSVVWFVTDVFRTLPPVAVAIAAVFPTTLIYLIATYAKVTHFYTLIVGLVMMTISVLLMLHALLFATRGWVRRVVIACVLVLLNPAVHYLVLFSVFFAIAGVTLLLGELARWLRTRGPRRMLAAPRQWWRIARSRVRVRLLARILHRWGQTTLGRGLVAAAVFVGVTLVPYYLFVTYVALRGVENLSETVPGDYYFIRDASVSWLHMFSWDLAGIMDKVFYGDYLAKVPRYTNVVYSVLFFVPLVVPQVRRALLATRAHRQLFGVVFVVVAFAMWATIGYAEPGWFPTFHRSLSAVTRALYATDSPIGELALSLSSTVVQVLRFPHRFQLILFMLAPMVMTLTLAWAIGALTRRWMRRFDANRPDAPAARRRREAVVLQSAAGVAIAAVFFAPFWSNANYRAVFGSGDFGTFLAPYPVGDLQELKQEILELPEGKTVVLPPTETAKLVTDDNGVDHKFIDKFFIYYLDEPSFYYGLTGDSANKFAFFLILRGLYYQQDWWINPARDLGIRYMVVNKQLRDNRGVGAEYLPNVESYVGPAMERQEAFGLVEQRFENDTFILYELSDRAEQDREQLVIDSSWTAYLQLVWNRLDLTRCYDFQYFPTRESDLDSDPLVYSDADPAEVAIDLWAGEHEDAFFVPSPKMFAFDPNIVSSSYYLSPMFREFLFFSNTKWNRTEMITPGVFGTLEGSFVAVPRPTSVSIPVRVPEDGEYRVLLRGAVSGNAVTVESSTLDFLRTVELRPSADAVQFYDEDTVYTQDRVAVDTARMPIADLERELDAGLVAVNSRNEYQDLGVVHAAAGAHAFQIDKLDANPLLIEGVVLIPEDEYQRITTAPAPRIVDSVADLECNDQYEVFGVDSEGYVDPAANGPHEDLSNEELLTLAASGVTSLVPDDSGGIGDETIVLLLTAGLVLAAILTVRSRTRPRSDERTDASIDRTEGH